MLNFQTRTKKPIDNKLSVNIEEVKEYLRITHDKEQNLLKRLIKTAQESAEDYLGLCLTPTKLELLITGSVDRCLILPYLPIQSIEDLTIISYQERHQLVLNQDYWLEGEQLLFLKSHYDQQFIIKYTAGYSENNPMPAALKQALIAHVYKLYQERLINPSFNDCVRHLYQQFKKIFI